MGIFGSAAAAASGSNEEQENKRQKVTGERRVKLWKTDSVAAQVLNPYGPSSPLRTMDTAALWSCAAKGNKFAAFHTELASTDKGRVGIGLSRHAETLGA